MSLLDKRLVFVTGKGGVGKTTACASIARLAAARGKRVLVCEIDAESSIGRLFGDRRVGYEPARMEQGIWACNLTGRECMETFVRGFVPSRRVADLIMKNRVANVFFESAPSVMEAVILDRLAQLAAQTGPPWDMVVADLPASGHAVTLLNVPRAMTEMVQVGELARRMSTLASLLGDPTRSELVLVSLPEEMSVNETVELYERARAEVATPVRVVILNGERTPDLLDADYALVAREASAASDDTRDTLQRVTNGVALGVYWRDEDQRNIARLEESVAARVVRVPFVFRKVDEGDLVGRVSDALSVVL